MQAIDISELPEKSALMKRFDRKFLCSEHQLGILLQQLDETHCYVNVQGEPHQVYENEYWDMPAWDFYHDHRRGVPRRLKFRRRTYRTNGASFWELKVKHPRGYQDKRRVLVEGQHQLKGLDSGQANRVYESLLGNDLQQQRFRGLLEPSMQINYRRITLWDPRTGARLTADTQLQASLDGWSIDFPGWVLVELKQARRERHALDALAARGLIKPCSFSKYYRTMQIWAGLRHGTRREPCEMRRYEAWVGQGYIVRFEEII